MENNKSCRIKCGRSFCEINDCLQTHDVPEINKIIFNEYIEVLRCHSNRGQLITDLFLLIKKYDRIIKEEAAMIEFIKEFDQRGPRTFNLNGVLLALPSNNVRT